MSTKQRKRSLRTYKPRNSWLYKMQTAIEFANIVVGPGPKIRIATRVGVFVVGRVLGNRR